MSFFFFFLLFWIRRDFLIENLNTLFYFLFFEGDEICFLFLTGANFLFKCKSLSSGLVFLFSNLVSANLPTFILKINTPIFLTFCIYFGIFVLYNRNLLFFPTIYIKYKWTNYPLQKSRFLFYSWTSP